MDFLDFYGDLFFWNDHVRQGSLSRGENFVDAPYNLESRIETIKSSNTLIVRLGIPCVPYDIDTYTPITGEPVTHLRWTAYEPTSGGYPKAMAFASAEV